ncbi:tRNA pseudouridine(55) synthase TruB [Candidatus Falkowbacteria bacterium]|nr:tRNA pseudouridine(55) synthase TruB [Candidatus Falkowbacteria bacterium]
MGFILIDKPAGITSFGVIARLRKITGIKKIGHAGTLDPFATGLLIVAISREATRKIDQYVKLDKEYEALIDLSEITDTYDKDGKTIFEYKGEPIKKKKIKKVLKSFVGKQKQVPPMFSAKKIGGKKLYELARKGQEIERQANDIEIYNIKILKHKWPLAKIRVKVSSGTYIRSLAYDIGRNLGTGGYLKELRRIQIGKFGVKKAYKIEKINKDNWQKHLLKNV